jgi:SAM-dependent methyltransferase
MRRATTEFNADQYASIHPPGIEYYYWHRARNRIVSRKLRGRLSPDDFVLDVGCGVGVVVAHLRNAGFDCEGADIGTPTTVTPGAEGHLHLGQDAFEMPVAFRDRVSAILLMDVIEHLPDPSDFLRRCHESFHEVRWIFVTVPARMEIWSNYDEYNGHYRRYTLESLRGLATPPGFTLTEVGYFFHTLYWAARIHQRLVRKRATTLRPPRHRQLHDWIGRVLDWEERSLPATSPGSSLYAVYARRG